MLSTQIKRHVAPQIDPKQLLRSHVEQMPIEKQYEFVEAALQLIDRRGHATKTTASHERELLH